MKSLIILSVLIIIATLFAVPAYTAETTSDKVYLYVFFHDDNTAGERFRTLMPDMQTCMEAVKAAKVTHPDKVGGDYEVAVAMWCGGEDYQRNYGPTWWRDPIKESN